MEKSVQEDVLKWMLGQAFRAEDHKKRLDEFCLVFLRQ